VGSIIILAEPRSGCAITIRLASLAFILRRVRILPLFDGGGNKYHELPGRSGDSTPIASFDRNANL